MDGAELRQMMEQYGSGVAPAADAVPEGTVLEPGPNGSPCAHAE